MIPFVIVRDFLHAALPESRNKTSRACQRRVNYMMRNPTTIYQVETAVEELNQEAEVLTAAGVGPVTKAERLVGSDKLEELTVDR